MGNIPVGSAVVARYVDGRVLKGTTHDFAPLKGNFHLTDRDKPTAKAIDVSISELKAVFFVRTYDGNSKHVESRDVTQAKGHGRKLFVTFTDGEVIGGFTTGYSKDKQGFFVIPVDPNSNNTRVYVVNAAVKKVEWADATAAERALA